MSIRRAKSEDCAQLVPLLNQLGYPLRLETVQQNLDAYLQDPERAVLVFELGRQIVGCLALDIAQTFHQAEKQMRVVSLIVESSHRGKGIGKRLLGEAEKLAREEGCWVVEITSSSRREKEGTHDFYLGQGYFKNGAQAYFRKLLFLKN